jgi:hypothetical protein
MFIISREASHEKSLPPATGACAGHTHASTPADDDRHAVHFVPSISAGSPAFHAEKFQCRGKSTVTPMTYEAAEEKDRPEDHACPQEDFFLSVYHLGQALSGPDYIHRVCPFWKE